MKKYNDLVLQAAQGRDVQKELNDVIGQIAKIMPSAVTEVDAYGRAIEISTGKVQEMLKYQRELYEINKKTTAENLGSQYNAVRKEFDRVQKNFNSGRMTDTSFWGTFKNAMDPNRTGVATRPMTDKDREGQLKKLAELEARQEALRIQLNDLNNPKKDSPAPKTAPSQTPGNFTGAGKSTNPDKPKKEIDELKGLKEQIKKLREGILFDTLTDNERKFNLLNSNMSILEN